MLKNSLICIVPALLITLAFYFVAPGVTKPSAAAAANVISPATIKDFYADFTNLQSQLEMYRFEHNNSMPDFATQGWTQLTTRTDSSGKPTNGEGAVGPYLRKAPLNPFTNSSDVLVVKSAFGGFKPSGKYGYVMDQSTGRLFAVAAEGKLFLD